MKSIIRKKLTVGGMYCGSCAVSTGMTLKNIPGIISARVDFDTKTADVEYDSYQATISDMNRALEALGYRLKGELDD